MSNAKRKITQKKGIFQNYLKYIISFLIAALAVTVAALCIANKPVTELVHKVENALPMQVRDIVADSSGSYQNCEPRADYKDLSSLYQYSFYGDVIGNITIESCGVNCDIYYGANRVSWRYGAGLDAEEGSENINLIKAYDETCFAGLKYAQVGDIITVKTAYDEQLYQIKDMKYINADKDAYPQENKDMLVLCSIFSDFSEHKGEYLYVFADRINGEEG